MKSRPSVSFLTFLSACSLIFGIQATPVPPNPTITPDPEEVISLNVTGKVLNQTGESIPVETVVKLTTYLDGNRVLQEETRIQTDGTYLFSSIQLKRTNVLVTTVEIKGIIYTSDVYSARDLNSGDTVNLPIVLFDATASTVSLTAERMHLFIQPGDENMLDIVQLFIIRNNGNQVIVPTRGDGFVLRFSLPENARNLLIDSTSSGQNFITTDYGFGDPNRYYPGSSHQILFSYQVPLSSTMTIRLPIPLDVDSAVIMLPTEHLRLKSEQLVKIGQRETQDATLDVYATSKLIRQSTLSLTLVKTSPIETFFKKSNSVSTIVGAVFFGIVVIFALWYLSSRGNPHTAMQNSLCPESESDLLDAVLALDDLHRAGKLPDNVYYQRRAALKERIRTYQQSS